MFPDLPSIGETVPGYDVSLYYGVSGPKGIPPRIVEILSNALQIALRDPKMLRRIAEFGGTPLSLTAGGVRQARVGRDGALGQGGGDDRVVD